MKTDTIETLIESEPRDDVRLGAKLEFYQIMRKVEMMEREKEWLMKLRDKPVSNVDIKS